MSFISPNFSYNNISSQEMNVCLITNDESNLTQIFSPTVEIMKDKIKGRDSAYIYGIDRQPLTIPSIKITKIDETPFSFEDRVEIMAWLCKDNQFHPFISDDFPEVEFSLKFNKASFTNFFNNHGYYELSAESNLPYPTSSVLYSNFDLSTNPTSKTITLMNNSNVLEYYYPMIEFALKGSSTSFKIINHTTGQTFEFTGLSALETVNVDNLNKRIKSSTNLPRLSNFNKNWLKLAYGLNNIEVFGTCILDVKCQFPMAL